MAKPIRATPTLRGEDAVRFVKQMLKEERSPSRARVTTIRNALQKSEYFRRFLVS